MLKTILHAQHLLVDNALNFFPFLVNDFGVEQVIALHLHSKVAFNVLQIHSPAFVHALPIALQVFHELRSIFLEALPRLPPDR